MNEYEQFAKIYDRVMDQTVYDRWIDYTKHCLAKRTEDRNATVEVLELACGTGAVAMRLAQLGHTVYGMDLSENMLMLAQEKSLAQNVDVAWLQGDMRSFAVDNPVDAITLFSDSLCYLIEQVDVEQTFFSVANALRPDGVFMFDVHSPYQMEYVFPGYQYVYQDDTSTFIWESFALEEPLTVEHVITIFLADQAGQTYRRSEEVHVERSFTMGQYVDMLKKAGFTQIEVSADFGAQPVSEKTPRWFFCCQKRPE